TTSFTDSGGASIADPLSLSTTQSAADAVIKVNGQQATRSTNTISDVIQGVTLSLAGTDASGVTSTLTVANDQSTVKKNIQSFVDAYNALNKSLDKLQSGALSSDNTVSLIRSQLLGVLNTPASGVSTSYSYLAGIGVAIQKDGSMGIDSTQLDTALNTDPRGVAQLFLHDTQGFATRLGGLAQDMAAPGGLVDTETQSLNNNISSLQNQIDTEQKNLDIKQQSLQAEYSSLDALMGTMQTTSSFLTQQLANLPA
ncbi:MAG TPA: flagellar filament capping protein FliD, partial [Gammaproteobacteria bacterium]|nr:flagellar filament capping protein FliD [Gammaproteobacteria bacterium]